MNGLMGVLRGDAERAVEWIFSVSMKVYQLTGVCDFPCIFKVLSTPSTSLVKLQQITLFLSINLIVIITDMVDLASKFKGLKNYSKLYLQIG